MLIAPGRFARADGKTIGWAHAVNDVTAAAGDEP